MWLLASVAVRAAPTSWPAAVFSARLRAAVAEGNAGGLLMSTSAATWKTSESPYTGRWEPGTWATLLLRGPYRGLSLPGTPRSTTGLLPSELPSAREKTLPKASVPSCSQPVKTWLLGLSTPVSALMLASSSQDPS